MDRNIWTFVIAAPIAYLLLGVPGIIGCVIGFALEARVNEKTNNKARMDTSDHLNRLYNLNPMSDLKDLIIQQKKEAVKRANRILIIVLTILVLMIAKTIFDFKTDPETVWGWIDATICLIYVVLAWYLISKRKYYKQQLKKFQED